MESQSESRVEFGQTEKSERKKNRWESPNFFYKGRFKTFQNFPVRLCEKTSYYHIDNFVIKHGFNL